MSELIIQRAEIAERKEDDDSLRITWEGTNGFGNITFLDRGSGVYELDSEMLNLDTVFKIIKAIK